jgi:hypothetical protein
MTIAIGLLCTDGVVLASDTEETWANLTKRNIRKIHAFAFERELTCAIAASTSNVDLMQMFAADVDGRLWAGMDAGGHVNIAEITEQAAKKLFDTNVLPFATFPADQRPQYESLIGYFNCDSFGLYKVGLPQTLVEVSEKKTGSLHSAIGIGSMIADSTLDSFHTERMTVEATADLAVYIISHTKEVVTECGGYTHVVLQRTNGLIEHLDPGYVDALQKWFVAYDEVVGEMLRIGLTQSFSDAAHQTHSWLLQMERQKPKQQRIDYFKQVGH